MNRNTENTFRYWIGKVTEKVSTALFIMFAAHQLTSAATIDTVFLVDETGGMAAEIAALRSSAGLLVHDATLTAAGHDTHYGLVTFADAPTFQQDLVDIAAFAAPGSPWSTMSTGPGALENGALAISSGATAGFRPGSFVNFVLFTDFELGDWNALEQATAIADMLNLNATFWLIADLFSTGGGNYSAFIGPTGSFDSSGNPLTFWAAQAEVEVTLASIASTMDQRIQLGIAQPNAVPVPPSVWLFGSALGLLGWMKRNKVA